MPRPSYPPPPLGRNIPLVERGAEALAHLLNYQQDAAQENLRLLTLSELTYLAIAADQLGALARQARGRPWPPEVTGG